jgi:hypothetical protein
MYLGESITPESAPYLGGIALGRGSDASDVGGQEVEAVSVKVASGTVVALGGPGVGVAGEGLRVTEWNAAVEGVGDRGSTQGVRPNVTHGRTVSALPTWSLGRHRHRGSLRVVIGADIGHHSHRPLLQPRRLPLRGCPLYDCNLRKVRSLRTCRGGSHRRDRGKAQTRGMAPHRFTRRLDFI